MVDAGVFARWDFRRRNAASSKSSQASIMRTGTTHTEGDEGR
jgi:hypothetical protein